MCVGYVDNFFFVLFEFSLEMVVASEGTIQKAVAFFAGATRDVFNAFDYILGFFLICDETPLGMQLASHSLRPQCRLPE
ncbi:hypothetical protein D9M73_212970 [compost metagenome]